VFGGDDSFELTHEVGFMMVSCLEILAGGCFSVSKYFPNYSATCTEESKGTSPTCTEIDRRLLLK
jgi:hypothetical protein